MTKVHAVEKELSEALELKRKSGESDKSFQAKLHKAAMECDKDVWDNLTEAAQGWVNAVQAYHDHKDGKAGRSTYPKDYDDQAQSDPKEKEDKAGKKSAKKHIEDDADSSESKEDKPVSTKKTKSAGKKKAAPVKEIKAVKKSTPAKKAKSGAVGATPEWLKTLSDIGAKGSKGATGEEIEKICNKHGVRPFFARFVRAGYLDRVERGVYALSPKGKTFIKEAA